MIMSDLRLAKGSDKNLVKILVLCALVKLGNSQYKDYSRFIKFNVQHTNENVYNHLIFLEQTQPELDFWLLSRESSVILVPPELNYELQYTLNYLGAPYNGTLLGDTLTPPPECEDCEKARKKRQSSDFFGRFQRYNAIVDHLRSLARKYPQHARFDWVTQTAEGRRLAVIRIAPYRRLGKKLIYIQAGSHAREWISVSTVVYFVTELLEKFESYKNILYGVEIGVVPVLNPDGYEYTHTKDRLWRKNLNSSSSLFCRGVDLNRNFGFKWGYTGASTNPCSEVYAGQLPFSEPESEWVRRYLLNNQYRTKLVLDVHSFGKFLFYPWGYSARPAPTRSALHKIGIQVANAIQSHRGTKYSVGSSAKLLYKAAGSLDDYAYGSLGIPFAYTFELPGSGFRISPNEIVPVGKETFAGFLEFIRIVNGS